MKKCQFHKWSQLTETEQRCRACGRKRRRIAKAKKKHRIAPASKGKLSWLTLYRREIAKDKKDGAIACASCGRRRPVGELDPHHPCGRGVHILYYFWICKSLHRKIHDNGTRAREVGWIQPEFDGRSSALLDPPMPWLGKPHSAAAIKAGFTCDDKPITPNR